MGVTREYGLGEAICGIDRLISEVKKSLEEDELDLSHYGSMVSSAMTRVYSERLLTAGEYCEMLKSDIFEKKEKIKNFEQIKEMFRKDIERLQEFGDEKLKALKYTLEKIKNDIRGQNALKEGTESAMTFYDLTDEDKPTRFYSWEKGDFLTIGEQYQVLVKEVVVFQERIDELEGMKKLIAEDIRKLENLKNE